MGRELLNRPAAHVFRKQAAITVAQDHRHRALGGPVTGLHIAIGQPAEVRGSVVRLQKCADSPQNQADPLTRTGRVNQGGMVAGRVPTEVRSLEQRHGFIEGLFGRKTTGARRAVLADMSHEGREHAVKAAVRIACVLRPGKGLERPVERSVDPLRQDAFIHGRDQRSQTSSGHRLRGVRRCHAPAPLGPPGSWDSMALSTPNLGRASESSVALPLRGGSSADESDE